MTERGETDGDVLMRFCCAGLFECLYVQPPFSFARDMA